MPRRRYGDKVKRVIFFGSVTRGDFNEKSNIDVLVVGSITLDEAASAIEEVERFVERIRSVIKHIRG